MSFPERTVILSPKARIDFTDILLYTLQEWGEAQRNRYEAALLSAFATLAQYPEAGERHPRLFPECRIRRVERHILYYRVMGIIVEVMRILHDRIDPTRHL